MLKVEVAKTAGFCFGVKRAMDTVYDAIEKDEVVYTYGPIIHNEQVVQDLENKGVRVLREKNELKEIENGSIVIRAHGVTKDVCEIIEKQGLKLVDATCPFVKKIHKIVLEESEKGNTIVIIGNPTHPEVEGICSWCTGDFFVIENEEQAVNFAKNIDKKLCIVSQTTFNYNKFKLLVEIISKKGYDISVFNTICNATKERQEEAKSLASRVDAMIVIGGKNSSNTQNLFEIS